MIGTDPPFPEVKILMFNFWKRYLVKPIVKQLNKRNKIKTVEQKHFKIRKHSKTLNNWSPTATSNHENATQVLNRLNNKAN